MGTPTKFYIVAASALPEIFIKVAEAKRLLETGEEKTGERVRARSKRDKRARWSQGATLIFILYCC